MFDPQLIQIQRLSTDTPRYAEPIVLLHGWGIDSTSWQPLLPWLTNNFDVWQVSLPSFADSAPCENLDDWLEALALRLPERYVLLGWSLGGMLALQLAARNPKKVLGLITLASNLSFVAQDDWLNAMPISVFDEFYQGFQASAAMTLKRFAGLMAKGSAEQERSLVKSLRQLSQQSAQVSNAEQWDRGLRWLQQLDNRAAFASLKQPGLHLLAQNDALVPAQVHEDIRALNAQQQVALVANACHALHWCHTQQVAECIEQFAEQLHHQVDKARVAQSFGRAAHSYDSVAGLQRDIGHSLMDTITVNAQPDGLWLDLGCGTGYFEPLLCEHLAVPAKQLLALDLSQGMLHYASQQRQGDYQWLCGDAESLPLASSSLDGVFSSLAIQWCCNLNGLFAELKRVLKPGGCVYLATLGPATLQELRMAWGQVDQFTHVNRFASEQQLRNAVAASGLTWVNGQTEERVLRYSHLHQLTHELKALGAHNMNHGRASGLTGRQRLQAFKQAYESFRQEDGLLPATYEVFYLQLRA